MNTIITFILLSSIPTHQSLSIRIDPATHTVHGETTITVEGPGELQVEGAGLFTNLSDGDKIEYQWQGTFQDSVEAGERVGQIHNFSVDAHVSEQGVFLSDHAPWYPKPVDANGMPYLRMMDLEVAPIDGWTFVGSGNLVDGTWSSPRPVDGMALVGNKHVTASEVVHTVQGPVTINVHLSPEHEGKLPYYLQASKEYLDLYTPLLGAYPYDQFTVVENFFSSGFAYPGFTVLGPRVVGMAPKSLAPGYLDHELVHNWWGNGVYVDQKGGNWCEALTSFTTNYGRRYLEDGQEAARRYRRGLLNKVSLDPSLDNGPLRLFGSADPSSGTIDRFVGYDKGAYVFMMLEDVLNAYGDVAPRESKIWEMLHLFAQENMGKRASWHDIQVAAEAMFPDRPSGWLDPFFELWVTRHTLQSTTFELTATPPQQIEIEQGPTWIDIDHDYKYYRVLPQEQISPTIAGTLAGTSVVLDESVQAIADTGAWLADVESGPNFLLIGESAIHEHEELWKNATDAISFIEGGFQIDGKQYVGEDLAVLHTMQHPKNDDLFVTVFYSVGDVGWERLRFIWYYTKDTTVIWDEDETLVRRVFEPTTRLTIKE
ncbi:MAG: hypothetical protein QGI78_05625 [Phycisphaerales bacterium]|jgi:hypothetical protein|nr:hypothetical protein [Phycisphaerales bacterium]